MKKNEQKNKHTNWRTTRGERGIYITGDLARGFNSTAFGAMITLFLMFQGIDLASLAVVTLLIKVVDSVDDVLFGFIIDRFDPKKMKHLSKFLGQGKYLPWYRLTFLMFPLATIAFYLMPSGISNVGKIAWYVVTYLLFDLTYTLCEVPMNSMIMTITDSMEERHYIQTVRAMFVVIGAIAISVLTNFLVSEYVGLSIRAVGIGVTLIFAALMVPLALKGKEHNVELKNVESDKQEEYSFKQMFQCLKGNKYLLIYLLSLFIMTVLVSLNGAMGMFVGFYIFQNSQVGSIAVLVAFIPSLIMMTQAQRVTKKVGGNRRLLIGMSIFFAVLYIMMFFFAKGNIVSYVIFTVLITLPNSFMGVIRSFIIPDAIEYTRYKTGQDCSGIFYALLSFVNKMTASVGSSIGLLILGLCGWVSVTATDFADLAAQNVVQPQGAIDAMWFLSTVVPAIGALIGAALLIFYRLNDRDAELMAQCNAGDITREDCEAQLTRKYD